MIEQEKLKLLCETRSIDTISGSQQQILQDLFTTQKFFTDNELLWYLFQNTEILANLDQKGSLLFPKKSRILASQISIFRKQLTQNESDHMLVRLGKGYLYLSKDEFDITNPQTLPPSMALLRFLKPKLCKLDTGGLGIKHISETITKDKLSRIQESHQFIYDAVAHPHGSKKGLFDLRFGLGNLKSRLIIQLAFDHLHQTVTTLPILAQCLGHFDLSQEDLEQIKPTLTSHINQLNTFLGETNFHISALYQTGYYLHQT